MLNCLTSDLTIISNYLKMQLTNKVDCILFRKRKMKYIILVPLAALSILSMAGLVNFGERLQYHVVSIIVNYGPILTLLCGLSYFTIKTQSKKTVIILSTLSIILLLSIRFPSFYGLMLMLQSTLYAKIVMTSWFVLILIPSYKILKH